MSFFFSGVVAAATRTTWPRRELCDEMTPEYRTTQQPSQQWSFLADGLVDGEEGDLTVAPFGDFGTHPCTWPWWRLRSVTVRRLRLWGGVEQHTPSGHCRRAVSSASLRPRHQIARAVVVHAIELEDMKMRWSNGLEVDVVGPGVPLVYALGGGAPPLRPA